MSLDTIPDYHFLYIAPSLGAEWFFEAARSYFTRFTPTVISDLELVQLLPDDVSITITVIARRDRIAEIGVSIAQQVPQAQFDPVVEDLFEDLRAALDVRAANNQPFGVPLSQTPMPTNDPRTPLPVTPGAIFPPVPTRGPAGFITQTPTGPVEYTPTPPVSTPAGSPTPTPTPTGSPPTALPTGEGGEPLQPTPGSVIGG